ncbi:MAG TPA: polysaccharide deacetylase family protein [Candidatus Paceibacterota bacterium]|nr:polysaccharide deacetylase family protein [Candidatus Paceibacterota bacterium]
MSLIKEGALARLGRAVFSLTNVRASGLVVSALFALAVVVAPTAAMAATFTSITASDASGTYGGTVNLSATLQYYSGGFHALTGKTVTFKLNGTTVGATTTDSSGKATLNNVSLSGINANTYNSGVSASFAGDSTYSSDSDTSKLTVSKANPTLSVTNSPQAYTGSPIAAAVSGSVAGTVSNVKYNNSSTVPTNAGTYPITASFAPTDTTNYNSLSSASAGSFVITGAPTKANTLTVITSDTPDPSNTNAAYTVNVSVGRLSGTNSPSGTVTVSDGSATCAATLSGSSATTTGSCQLTSTTSGSKTLTATYSGDTNFNTSSGTASHTVNNVAGPDCSNFVDLAHNLINNPCLETGSAWNGTTGGPDNWSFYSAGVTGGATYPATSYHSGTGAAEVHISAINSPADPNNPPQAQWGFNPVNNITPGANYQFSFWYNSNVDSEVDAEYDTASGPIYTQVRSNLPSTNGAWVQFTTNIIPPAGTTAMSITPLISKVGNLTVDDFSLVQEADPNAFATGMVSLNFDDGLASFWNYATSTLNAAGIKATEYIITGASGSDVTNPNPSSGYLSRTQIQALAAAGYDIGDHTTDHADLTNLSSGQTLTSEINNSVAALNNIGISSVSTIAYPYGTYNQAVESQVLHVPLLAGRSVDDGFNDKKTDPYALRIKEVFDTTSVSQVESWIDEANANNEWLILLFHTVDKDSANGLDCTSGTPNTNNPQECVTTANLQAIVSHLNSTHTHTVTMSQGIGIMNGTSVIDQTAPTVTVPSNISVPATSQAGATVTFSVTATDNIDLNPSILCMPASGSVFAFGTTTVGCSATDASGNKSATSTFDVGVYKPTLTITADNQTTTFGYTTEPTYTVTITGFQGTDDATVLTTQPTCSVAVDHSAVGTYPITCSGAADTDGIYVFNYVNGTLTVAPVDGTVVLNNLTQTYDGTPKAVATSTGDVVLSVTVTYAGTGGTTYALSTVPPTDAGTYDVVATIDAGQSYSGSAEGTLTIAKAAVDGAESLNQSIDVVENSTNNPITLGTLDSLTSPAWTIATQPTSGTIGGTAPAVTYTPAADFYGSDSFSFTVGDANHVSGTATVNIMVHPAPGCPSGYTANGTGGCDPANTTVPVVCPNGTAYNATDNMCEDTQTSVAPTDTLTCPDGSTLDGTQCDTTTTTTQSPTCGDGSEFSYDADNNTCVPTDPNDTTTPPSPTCAQGMLNGQNQCEVDTTTQTPAQDNLTCPDGYTLNSNECDPAPIAPTAPTCPANSTDNGDGTCATQTIALQCITGYHLDDATGMCDADVLYAITASTGDNGSISPSGSVSVVEHASQSFSIAANSGYHISDVVVDGSSVGAVSSYSFSDIGADHTISASFAQDAAPAAVGGGGGGGGGGILYYGNVSINNGAAETSSPNVTLTVTATGGLSQVWLSNDSSFSTGTWQPIQSPIQWTLASGAGQKTIYARFGIASSTYANAQASIQLTSGGVVLGASIQILTDAQIAAILNLLTSFNADQSVIDSVNAALHGEATSGTGGSATSDGFVFTQTLQVGSTGNQVTELQKRLTAEGVYSGPITGYFGALTKAGVIAYQAKKGLPQVGIVGPMTRAALNGQ